METRRTRKRQHSIDITEMRKRRKASKKPRLERDYSMLPTEMLLKIFGYLKKEDNCIKNLTETCHRFNDICQSRLALCVDFNRVTDSRWSKKEEYPEIIRSYDQVNLYGREVDPNTQNLKNLLALSKYSVKCLEINRTIQSWYMSQINCRTLVWILDFFPNLDTFKASGVKALAPALKFEALREHEYPALKRLKTLHLQYCNVDIVDCFKNATKLQDFQINGYPNYTSKLKTLTFNQPKLRILQTVVRNVKTKIRFNNLKTLMYPAKYFPHIANSPKNLMKNAPRLKHLKLFRMYSDANEYPLHTWMNFINPTLQSFEIEGRVNDQLSVEVLRNNFPALKSFKSVNVNWKLATASNKQ